MRTGGLVPVDVEADECLFAAVPVPGQPLVEFDGIDAADAKTVLTWQVRKAKSLRELRCRGRGHAIVRPGGDGSTPKEWDWNQWIDFAGEPPAAGKPVGKVIFEKPVTGLRDLAALKPSDVVVGETGFPRPDRPEAERRRRRPEGAAGSVGRRVPARVAVELTSSSSRPLLLGGGLLRDRLLRRLSRRSSSSRRSRRTRRRTSCLPPTLAERCSRLSPRAVVCGVPSRISVSRDRGQCVTLPHAKRKRISAAGSSCARSIHSSFVCAWAMSPGPNTTAGTPAIAIRRGVRADTARRGPRACRRPSRSLPRIASRVRSTLPGQAAGKPANSGQR